MAQYIEAMSIYRNGQKIGRATGVSLSINGNDQSTVVSDGYLGHTSGKTTSSGSIDTVIAVDGKDSDLIDVVLQKEYVDFTYTVGNRLLQLTGRLVNSELSSEYASGTLTGRYSLEGGEPKVVG